MKINLQLIGIYGIAGMFIFSILGIIFAERDLTDTELTICIGIIIAFIIIYIYGRIKSK